MDVSVDDAFNVLARHKELMNMLGKPFDVMHEFGKVQTQQERQAQQIEEKQTEHRQRI